MSKRKRRNAEDRRLVLATVNPQAALYARPDRVRAHFDHRERQRLPFPRGERRGNGARRHSFYWPLPDTKGRHAWRLYREIFGWLCKHGFVRKRSTAQRNDRHPQTGLKKRGRTHSRVEVMQPATRPRHRRNERRGQSKPGYRP